MDVPGYNFKLNKKWVILGAIGFVVLFLVGSFLVSYYEYKTTGPISEEPVSSYDDASFKRLQEELTKDKPQPIDQKEVLDELVKQTNEEQERQDGSVRRVSREELYTKGTFDTLAVNCGVLLEKYKELVIKYHELEKQLDGKRRPIAKKASPPARSSSSSGFASRSGSSRGGGASANGSFDYTRYVRGSGTNELLNEGGGGTVSGRNASFTWVTLSFPQRQRIFNQSVLVFDVAEPFVLDGFSVPRTARVEGVAQVSRGRGRIFVNFNRIYTQDQTIEVEGEAFALDRSRGLNVFIHGESSLAESFKREATDLVGLIDPSRTGVGRTVLQDTDVGQEVFGILEAGTMVLANLRRK